MTTTTLPAPRLPGFAAVYPRSIAIGTMMVGAMALFSWRTTQAGAGRDALLFYLLFSHLVAASFAAFTVWRNTRPLARMQAMLDAGASPDALPARDVVDAMRLPLRSAASVAVAYLAMIVVVYPLSAQSITVMQRFAQEIVAGGLALVVMTASNQYYVMHRLVRRRVSQIVLPAGRIDHFGEVRLLRVFHHVLALVLSSMVASPALLFVLLDNTQNRRDPVTLAIVAVVVISMLVHQVVGVLSVVSIGVGHLAEKMTAVREGNLQTRAEVRALDIFGQQASDFNRMVEGLRQRELLKETFGRYVTHQVADEILAGRISLGGELRTATVLFSDIRGFTRMSEKMRPVEVVEFLNEYLTSMVDCVIEHGGTVDKFIGDAVMAVFGVPVGRGDVQADARDAVRCAVAMGERLARINDARVARGLKPIEIGIGLHTGELVAGNIGSPLRMEYTVIGDTVNVGSRLESLTKELHRRTVLSEQTARLVDGEIAVMPLATIPVRGRREPLQVFGLVDEGPVPVVDPTSTI